MDKYTLYVVYISLDCASLDMHDEEVYCSISKTWTTCDKIFTNCSLFDMETYTLCLDYIALGSASLDEERAGRYKAFIHVLES